MKLFKYIIPSFIIFLLFGFFSSVNAAGPVLDWAKGVGGTGGDWGSNITRDSSGNTYTTGIFTGTVDFDPGAGTANLTSVGGNDIFVLKLDSSGDFVWVKQFGGTLDGAANEITLDSSGNIYITGWLV